LFAGARNFTLSA